MNGKGSDRRPETKPGSYAKGWERVFTETPTQEQKKFVSNGLKVFGEIAIMGDGTYYVMFNSGTERGNQ